MKGQMGIMEYMLMTLFIMVIIVILVFFLSGWQISQAQTQKSALKSEAVLSNLKSVLYSPLFTRENSMFDDAKLSALQARCEKLKEVLGADAFIEVKTLEREAEIPCDPYNYDIGCNYWSICKRDAPYSALVMPVNVFRNMGNILASGVLGRVDLATVRVGIYESQ